MADKSRRTAVKRHMRSASMEFQSADTTDSFVLDPETFGVMVRARLGQPDLDPTLISTWFEAVDVARARRARAAPPP